MTVADRLDVTPLEAKAEILRMIQRLEPAHFHAHGDGRPPPCDAYLYPCTHLVQGRWQNVQWYVKIGLQTGPKEQLWIESFHPEGLA